MKRTTQSSLSLSCIIGAIIGGFTGWYFHLPPLYYIMIWFLAVIGVSFYPERHRHRHRRKRYF